MISAVYKGTELGGPQWLADWWRAANIGLSAVLVPLWIGSIVDAVRGHARIPLFSVLGQASLLVFTERAVLGSIYRWHTPLTLEGQPLLTIALLLGLGNILLLRRAARGG